MLPSGCSDSHSRNEAGMPAVDGKSVLVRLTNIDDLALHLNDLAAALSDNIVTYEVVGIEATHQQQVSSMVPLVIIMLRVIFVLQ